MSVRWLLLVFLALLIIVSFCPLPERRMSQGGFAATVGDPIQPLWEARTYRCGVIFPWLELRHAWSELDGASNWSVSDYQPKCLLIHLSFFCVVLSTWCIAWSRWARRGGSVQSRVTDSGWPRVG